MALSHLWAVFWRLRRRRGGNGFGASPIEWPDIDAFARLSGTRLTPFDIEVIEDLDDAYLQQAARAAAGIEDVEE